jgi:acyl-coenzyme A thioesterase PaaI-like protein
MRVRVLELGEDWRNVRLLLPLARNRNPGGGMFGGAMACLADPVAALVCNRVFPGHQVWTRELTLDFSRESRTDMQLKFALAADMETQIRDQLVERGRATPAFEYAYFDTHGRVCASVCCRVAIRPLNYRPATMYHRSRNTDE